MSGWIKVSLVDAYPSGSSDDPESVVVAYFEAVDAGDVDTMNNLIHPDSPEEELSEEEGDDFEENVHIEVESTELLEEADGEAEVEIEYELDADDLEEPMDVTQTFFLEEYDGEWLILDT